MTYFLFIFGFVVLVKGADLLIEGASSVAKRFGLSDIVVGLTIVAFGTSAPELVVNVVASYQGNAGIAIANVLGSNIANTLLAIGVAAIITPLTVKRSTVLIEIPLGFLAGFVLWVLANGLWPDTESDFSLSRSDGVMLLCFFAVFFYYTFWMATKNREKVAVPETVVPPMRSVVEIALGLLGLVLGGKWVVGGAVAIAGQFGLSEALIGATVVAVGTSLPEIVTSAVSAYKGKSDIAIANAVGSNIFNIFWVLAVSAIVRPLPFDPVINTDILTNLAVSALLFAFVYIDNPRHILRRFQGMIFVAVYVAYVVMTVLRG